MARSSTTAPQATIDDPELRAANVRGGFVGVRPVDGAAIIVDDVMTTGATVREAARALLETEGVPRVYVFTLALGR